MSSTIDITIKNADQVAKYFETRPAEVKSELNRALTRSALIIQRMARQEAPVDMSRLRNSIAIQPLGGFGIAVTPKANYSVAVHEGSRPHWVPIKSLEGWARRHGFESAWPLAYAISRRGTKANPYMDRAAAKGTDDVQREFDNAVDRILGD
jgi:HK97 gp10 family phage protein